MFFFFNDTATTEIYTLSLHDALPIYVRTGLPLTEEICLTIDIHVIAGQPAEGILNVYRSEEHTSELQSRPHLVCRLLLEKKNLANLEANAPADCARLNHGNIL